MMHPVAWIGLLGISQTATGSLVAAVWQGILLAAAAWLGLRLLPKTPAAVRFAIWFGVFLLVAALPVIALWPQTGGAARPGGNGAWLTLDSRWSVAIAAIWAIASLLRAAILVVAAFRVRALWKRAEPVEIGLDGDREGVTPPQTIGPSEMGHPGVSLARRAEVCVSDEVDRPSVIGFFAPKILIPRWLLERLAPAELEQIVLHEAGHLRRADDWMNLLQKLALVVFPLNPALAWIERRLCFERELACDEQVLRDSVEQAGAETVYAACLVALAEYRMGRHGLTSGLALGFWGTLGRESELAQRVGRILAGGGRMKAAHARLVLGGAMLALVAGAVELPRCPQIVGFSSNSSAASDSVALRDGLAGGRAMPGFRAEPVVFRPEAGNAMLRLDPAHRDGAAMNGAQSGVSRSVLNHRSVARTHVSGARHGAPSFEASKARTGDWVVVMTWNSAAVSQVVMTPSERVYEQRVYRYAAVPVHGGWLVIQL
jgi:hypothetical protein